MANLNYQNFFSAFLKAYFTDTQKESMEITIKTSVDILLNQLQPIQE